MAAIHAAGPGRRVVLLESTRDGGRKILISGGGRCNILPGTLDEGRFVTDSSPNTLKKLLRAWPLAEQRRFFEERLGIPLALEAEIRQARSRPRTEPAMCATGCSSAARQAGVELRFESVVNERAPCPPPTAGRSAIRGQPSITADAVILATGGLSVPTTGSDGLGLRLAASLGHVVHPTYPALTPLIAAAAACTPISPAFRCDVAIRAGGRRSSKSEGGFLFTHRGYSGPSVLDISHVPGPRADGGRAGPGAGALGRTRCRGSGPRCSSRGAAARSWPPSASISRPDSPSA